MQLMAEQGVEHGVHRGLGWIVGSAAAIDPGPGLKVPHMGWNDLRIDAVSHPPFDGVDTGAPFPFVPSYRSAARRVGYACARTCRSRWLPSLNNNTRTTL